MDWVMGQYYIDKTLTKPIGFIVRQAHDEMTAGLFRHAGTGRTTDLKFNDGSSIKINLGSRHRDEVKPLLTEVIDKKIAEWEDRAVKGEFGGRGKGKTDRRKKLIQSYEAQIGSIPSRYVPASLSLSDLKKQLENLKQTRTKEEGEARPSLSSVRTRRSKWSVMAEKFFGPGNTSKADMARILGKTKKRSAELLRGLDEIFQRGEKAYYTSGSRPGVNQYQWGQARVTSVLFGGKARKQDADIVDRYDIPLLKA
jgi:hypothetical protein